MSERPRTVELSVNSRKFSIGSAAELMTSRFKRQVAITRFKIIVSPRTCEMNCYKVSLNDSETERESLGKRLQTAEVKADQFDQVVFDPQT